MSISIRAATQDPIVCDGKFWSELAGGKWVALGSVWTDKQWSDIEYHARRHIRDRRMAREYRKAGDTWTAMGYQGSANTEASFIRRLANRVLKYGSTMSPTERSFAGVFI